MIYKKLSQLQKIIAISLSFVGMYGSLPLPSQGTQVQAESVLSAASTAMPKQATHPSFLRLQVAQAETQQASRSTANPFETLPLLKERGAPAPGKRVGGGSRGGCPNGNHYLTALVPVIPATPIKSVLALTFSDHPTFWFYFPYSSLSTSPVQFILQDEKGKEIYKTELTHSGTTPGVVGFKLPNTAPPLEVNKRYKWYFATYCNPQDHSDVRTVEGWVQRVALDSSLQRELEQATPQQKVLLYTKVGVWHEAVTTLAELRRQKPNDVTLKQEWDKLMQAVKLDAIAPEPITSMLTPKK